MRQSRGEHCGHDPKWIENGKCRLPIDLGYGSPEGDAVCGHRCTFPAPVEVDLRCPRCKHDPKYFNGKWCAAQIGAMTKEDCGCRCNEVEAPAVAETCKWSWNDHKDFWASGCGDGLALDGGKYHFDFDQAFRFCPYCGKELTHE